MISDSELTRGAYIIVGTTSVFVWDALCHLRDDYRIVVHHKIGFPTGVYFVSRLFTLLYLVGNTLLQTTPFANCHIAISVATSPVAVSLAASELLLFLHVRAIYVTQRAVVWFFSVLWLVTVASAAASAAVISTAKVTSPSLCVPKVPANVGITMIGVHMVNDSLLFSALVWRILHTSTKELDGPRLKDNLKTALFGDYVPRLAKALLQNGQQYFLATVMIHTSALILFYSNAGNSSLGFPCVMLMNLMASRLYRKTKLDSFRDYIPSFILPNLPTRVPSAIVFTSHHTTQNFDHDNHTVLQSNAIKSQLAVNSA